MISKPTNPSSSSDLDACVTEALLPVVADTELACQPAAQATRPTVAAAWDPRVLVVDDDEISRGATVALLQALGLTVEVAAGGREALEMSARQPYAAIFMDCQMPEVDGYTAVRRLRRQSANSVTPVIAVTSRPRWVSLAAGMDHHLAKPLQTDTLRADCARLGLLAPAGDRPGAPAEILGAETPLLDPSIFAVATGDERVTAAARFIESATARLPELWRATNTGDGQSLRSLALAFEPRAARVGAARVAVLCALLADAAAGPAIAVAAGIEEQLRQAFQDTGEAIRAYVDGTVSATELAAQMPAGSDEPSPAGGGAATPRPPVRVALADDDPLARIAIAAMLERADWLTLVGDASGVDEIVELVAIKRPEVVVLDWIMPGGGGREAARRILARSPDTLIVALTSSDTMEALSEMTSAGASCLVAKGGSADQLTQTIARSLNASAAARAAEEEKRSARRGMGGGMRPDGTAPGDGPLDPAGVKRLQSEFGSTGILGELVELFGSQTPARLSDLRKAIEAGDAGAVSSHAHQLKGGCLTLAANQMAELCDELELSAGSGLLERAAALVDQIDEAFGQAHAALRREAA